MRWKLFQEVWKQLLNCKIWIRFISWNILDNRRKYLYSPPVIGAFENIDGVPTLVEGSETTPPDVKALQVGWGFGDDGLIPEVRDGVTTSPGLACEADLSVMIGEEVFLLKKVQHQDTYIHLYNLKNAGIDYTSDITQRFAGSHDGVIPGFIMVMLSLVLHMMTQEEH